MDIQITASHIQAKYRRHQGVVNGRWVIETDQNPDPLIGHQAGTLVADPAPGEPDSDTFTALDGKRYFDTPSHTQWTTRKD